MIVVTGGAGFIGSNLVRALNDRGRRDILVVDDFTDGHKFRNLASAQLADYLDHQEFKAALYSAAPWVKSLEIIYHLGACSDTTEWNGRYMMEANYAYSKAMLNGCEAHGIPLVYASSAAVYGPNRLCAEREAHEHPLNVYGYSKLLFDQHVRQRLPSLQIPVTGLRYFNVYGPGEQHKGRMASVVYHFNQQLCESAKVRLFEGSHGVGAGEQRRDFVHVEDVVDMTLWCGESRACKGILNCGAGVAATFNEVARAIIAWHGRGTIEYIPFPPDLLAAYQSHTCADLEATRLAGYTGTFRPVESGVHQTLQRLNG